LFAPDIQHLFIPSDSLIPIRGKSIPGWTITATLDHQGIPAGVAYQPLTPPV